MCCGTEDERIKKIYKDFLNNGGFQLAYYLHLRREGSLPEDSAFAKLINTIMLIKDAGDGEARKEFEKEVATLKEKELSNIYSFTDALMDVIDNLGTKGSVYGAQWSQLIIDNLGKGISLSAGGYTSPSKTRAVRSLLDSLLSYTEYSFATDGLHIVDLLNTALYYAETDDDYRFKGKKALSIHLGEPSFAQPLADTLQDIGAIRDYYGDDPEGLNHALQEAVDEIAIKEWFRSINLPGYLRSDLSSHGLARNYYVFEKIHTTADVLRCHNKAMWQFLQKFELNKGYGGNPLTVFTAMLLDFNDIEKKIDAVKKARKKMAETSND